MAVLLLCLLPYWAKGQQTSQPSLTVANEITTVQVFNRSVVLTPWPYDNVATSIEYGGSALNQGFISTIQWGLTCTGCCSWNMLVQFKWGSAPYTCPATLTG
eukprot:397479_1